MTKTGREMTNTGIAIRFAVVAVLLSAFVYWPCLFDKEYKVHTSGCVLVTGTSSGIGTFL